MHSRSWFVVGLVGLVVTAGCSGSDGDAAESTPPSSTEPVDTAAPDTTTPETTEVESTAPETSAAVATTAPETTAAPATTPPATAPPAAPTGPKPTSAIAALDDALVRLDPSAGTITDPIVDEFSGEGVFREGVQLTPDGSQAYFSEYFEDAWFGCETSIGSVGRVDLTTGELTPVAAGTNPALSPDGALLAFLDATQCLPDPEAPADWVLTPYDRVVVLDLVSGTRTEIASGALPTSYDDPNMLLWVGFDDDGQLLVATLGGAVHRLAVTDPGPVQGAPTVVSDLTLRPVGVMSGALFAIDVGDEGSQDLFRVDLSTGDITLLVASEAAIEVGISPTGHALVVGADPILVDDLGGAVNVVATGQFPSGLDW